MPLRQRLILAFQSITLAILMALALAGVFHSPRLFWISLPPLSGLIFYMIRPWPEDQR